MREESNFQAKEVTRNEEEKMMQKEEEEETEDEGEEGEEGEQRSLPDTWTWNKFL